jgi:hypothetical protein
MVTFLTGALLVPKRGSTVDSLAVLRERYLISHDLIKLSDNPHNTNTGTAPGQRIAFGVEAGLSMRLIDEVSVSALHGSVSKRFVQV